MTANADSRSQPRVPLSRERVLHAAVRLADEGGIESLTMRKLARELGVEAMSLYNHVANKGDLVDGIVDLVVAEIELPATADWEAAIRRVRDLGARDVPAPPLGVQSRHVPTTTRGARVPRLRYMEWLLGRLRDAGFSPELTYHAYHALDAHILGFTMWQLGHSAAARQIGGAQEFAALADQVPAGVSGRRLPLPRRARRAARHRSGDGEASEFEFGLDLILDGLKRAAGSAKG